MNVGLHVVDWIIIAIYALSTIGLGLYFSRKQASTDEYFVGSGNMGSFFIGVSLFATLLSTISYLSMPGEGAGKGPVGMIGMIAYPIIYLVVGYLIIPVYMKQRVTSAYELLEQRLGFSVSILGATMFLALRLVWMTLLVFVAANAMTVMMGIDYWIVDQDPETVVIRNAAYKWTESPSQAGEYYLELVGGGDPGLVDPANVREVIAAVRTNMSGGTVGNLAPGQWDFGDNDSLGFDTIYVKLTAVTDPDVQDEGHVTLEEPWIATAEFETEEEEKAFRGIYRYEDGHLQIAATPIVVIVAGIVSLIYTTLGGLRAVVITDFMQTLLLFGGALLVLITVTYQFGGFGWFPTRWQDNWDTQPIFPTSFNTRVTFVGTMLTILTWQIATLAGDQTSVQRFMATKDAATARRAVGTQLCVGFVIQVTLFAVGFALLAYFLQHRSQFPDDFTIDKSADDFFPHFISYLLPVGVSGLVAAAMFAAAMSSIDSGVNSITAVVTVNYVDRLGWKPKTEKGHLRLAQCIAIVVGLVVVFCSSFMKYIDGNITAVTNKTVNLLTTPIFALFFFALFVKSSRTLGVWIGAICGVTTAATIAFSGPIVVLLATHYDFEPDRFGVTTATSIVNKETKEETLVEIDPKTVVSDKPIKTAVYETDPKTGKRKLAYRDPISFQWIGPVALVVNIITGLLACWVINIVSPRKQVEENQSAKK